MKLIINTEVFLQCHGNCSGCFLTDIERKENINYLEKIYNPILEILDNRKDVEYEEIIIGFGRGNLLNLSSEEIFNLNGLINKLESKNKKIKFEISTSLIGKIDKMKESALLFLNNSKSVYFNIVINSDIVSNNFWLNYNEFTNYTREIREGWGWNDNTGDIFVLNINPEKLPDIGLIEKYFNNKSSPINISLFPFEGEINDNKLQSLNKWANTFWDKFSHLDLNIKNFLQEFNTYDKDLELYDLVNYHKKSLSSYFFVDKSGVITKGSLSTMGEVDYPRLVKKYGINPDVINAIKVMQRNKKCLECNYKNQCIGTGAYLTMLSNYEKVKKEKTSFCLNGYEGIFKESLKLS